MGSGAVGGGLDVVWVLRHGHIGDAFFDADAAAFLLGELEWRQEQAAKAAAKEVEEARQRQQQGQEQQQQIQQQQQQQQEREQEEQQQQQQRDAGAAAGPSGRGDAGQGGGRRAPLGAAVGPEWVKALPHGGGGGGGRPARVTIERRAEVLGVFDTRAEAEAALRAAGAALTEPAGGGSSSGSSDSGDWPAWLALLEADSGGGGGNGGAVKAGRALGADLVVSAIGVEPATEWLPGARGGGGEVGCAPRAGGQGVVRACVRGRAGFHSRECSPNCCPIVQGRRL